MSEAVIKIGLLYREEQKLSSNGTAFVVGEIVEIIVPDGIVLFRPRVPVRFSVFRFTLRLGRCATSLRANFSHLTS